MKKILINSTLLITITVFVFWQCEKSELSDTGEISFKSLNVKVWYPVKITIDGEDFIFGKQTSMEFEKNLS